MVSDLRQWATNDWSLKVSNPQQGESYNFPGFLSGGTFQKPGRMGGGDAGEAAMDISGDRGRGYGQNMGEERAVQSGPEINKGLPRSQLNTQLCVHGV